MCCRWQEKKHKWGTSPLDTLDVEVMRDEVNEFFKTAFTLHKDTKDDVTEYLLDCVKEVRVVVRSRAFHGNVSGNQAAK